jgi:hypothetical protein
MKKALFIVLFVLIATAVFGQDSLGQPILNDVFSTSEGIFAVAMFYHQERNAGQQLANIQANNPELSRVPSLTRGQTEAVRYALGRYQNRAGDTYTLVLINRTGSDVIIFVIVEMSSATDWGYWAYSGGIFEPTTPAQREETIYIAGLGNIRYSLSNNLGEIEQAIYSRTGRTVMLNNANWRLNTSSLSPDVKALMNRHNVNYSMTISSGMIVVNKRVGNEWYIFSP